MDITKRDSKMLKGVAILSMLMLHLFCRKENLPYTPLLWLGNTPLIYYFGLFGDICVAVYCFVSGYAHYLQSSKTELQQRWKRILRFLIPFWIIAVVFSLIGMLIGNAVVPGSMKEFLLNCLTIKNSYNGAWWYANTYILLVALQPLSKKFVERSHAWLVLLTAFAFLLSAMVSVFGAGALATLASCRGSSSTSACSALRIFLMPSECYFAKSRSFLRCGSA